MMNNRKIVSARLSAAQQTLLANLIRGEVLLPSDPRFGQAAQVFNARIKAHPKAIVRARDVDDVVQTVQFCTGEGLTPSVRAGGHGVLGHAVAGDIVIDLSRWSSVTVDPGRQVARIGAGARWQDVDATAWSSGLLTPGARISHIGVAGFTLGGGEGWLSRRYGLAADNLIRAELVCADGTRVVAADHSEPGLTACLRGSGGNFGVVTALWQQLHRPPRVLLGGRLLFSGRHARQALLAYSSFMRCAPEVLSGSIAFVTCGQEPGLPASLRGQPAVAINITVMCDDESTGQKYLDPLRRLAVRPVADSVAPVAYPHLQTMLDGHNQPGYRQHSAARYLPELSGAVIDALEEAWSRRPGPRAQFSLAWQDAAVARGSSRTSVFPHRTPAWSLYMMSRWTNPADDVLHTGWIRQFKQDLAPFAEQGCYLNMDDDHSPAAVRRSFRPHHRRIAESKQHWDPANIFRHTANIPPAPEACP
ncbi:FAD-binding protein [Streptomyces sp. NPDC008121]|uniref:FAD-binding oxidoreductase n=1 Tax=Streptomyces sp. NPDC008121 TaxID=3364809 RepID=UPI0036EE568F